MQIDEKRIRVLYVDDEQNNLLSFQANFRRKYQIFTASSASDGLKIIKSEPGFHVIIADQRMPHYTGVEFFNEVRKTHPDPLRILITGFTDAEAIIDAINKGEIYRYIKKPWDEIELQNAIQNAYDIFITRQELDKKMVELQKTNDELNRFVYSTSHDLRSPLASIMGILSLARIEESVVDPNNYLSMIDTCVTRMDVFIQKIIEYYKNIRVDDEKNIIDLKAVISDSITICKMQRPEVNFQLQVHQPVEFINDNFRLSVIVDNLISNAVKYQKPGGSEPRVTVRTLVDNEKALIEVEDNGIGIKEDHLNNVFKMFFRSTSSENGLGIGLFIVKEALTRIKGDISVSSEYGKGTTFKITVPNLAAQTAPVALASA